MTTVAPDPCPVDFQGRRIDKYTSNWIMRALIRGYFILNNESVFHYYQLNAKCEMKYTVQDCNIWSIRFYL